MKIWQKTFRTIVIRQQLKPDPKLHITGKCEPIKTITSDVK